MRRLYRSSKDKKIMGVCGGLGEYFGVDSAFFRILAVCLFFTPFGLIGYIALGIILPTDYTAQRYHDAEYRDVREAGEEFAEQIRRQVRRYQDSSHRDSRNKRRDVTPKDDDWSDF